MGLTCCDTCSDILFSERNNEHIVDQNNQNNNKTNIQKEIKTSNLSSKYNNPRVNNYKSREINQDEIPFNKNNANNQENIFEIEN